MVKPTRKRTREDDDGVDTVEDTPDPADKRRRKDEQAPTPFEQNDLELDDVPEDDFLVEYELTEESLGLQTRPQPLSQTPEGSGLTTSSSISMQTCATKPKLPRVALRVLYWNVERFGGLAQWGLPETRAPEVITAMAALIHLTDPHLVVLVEVMAHMGAQEVKRLREALEKLGNLWDVSIPPAFTGVVHGKAGTGETYAVLYRKGIGITPTLARIGVTVDKGTKKPFEVGTYQDKEGDTVDYRAPGEFVFTMGGDFALEDGGTWPLAIVAFHAPGPQASRERQAKIEEMIARVATLEVIVERETYPDCLVCADFNSHPDAYNISKEPKSSFDIALYELEEGEDTTDQIIERSGQIQEREAQQAQTRGKKYGLRNRNKVVTKVKTETATIVAEDEQERLLGMIRDADLQEEARRPRKRDIVEWRQDIEEILDSIDELERESSVEALRLLRELKSSATVEQADQVLRNITRAAKDREDRQQELLEMLLELEPRLEGIRYIEDMRAVIEQIRRPGTAQRNRIAQIKRDLSRDLKMEQEWEKFYYREVAYEGLDPKETPDDEVNFGAVGFFNNLSYDGDCLTTRRRTITALRSGSGKKAQLQLPESVEGLQFSKYDQVLPRTLGQLTQPQNCVLSLLAAVLSKQANQNLYQDEGNHSDAEAAEYLLHEGLRIPTIASDSPLASLSLANLAGIANASLKDTDTWTSARNRAVRVLRAQIEKERLSQEQEQLLQTTATAKLEDADPPNFYVLQLGLNAARALSDHDPMLCGFWVDRTPRDEHATPTTTTTGLPPVVVPPQQEVDYLAVVAALEQDAYATLCAAEGNAHPLADFVHAYMQRRLGVWRPQTTTPIAAQILTAEIRTIYDVATNYCNGTLAGNVFVDQPGGIFNAGNTCYLASLIQVLAAHPFYRQAIAGGPLPNAHHEVLRTVLDLVIRLVNNGQRVAWDVTALVREALIACGWHGGRTEQDPAELMTLLFDWLNLPLCMTLGQQTVRNNAARTDVAPPWVNDADCLLPLEIALAGTQASCLQRFAYEDLDSAQYGPTDTRIQVYRRITVSQPGVAVLQMKRYSNIGEATFRNDTVVTGFESVTLGGAARPVTGFIRHIGPSLVTGHYDAYVTRNGKHYRCNDVTVTDFTAKADDVAEALGEAYMFFYDNPAN
ncbi:MAG: hypothetical protein ACXW5U_25560 [Thermoanaerobaculia bacterium]